MPDNFDPQMQAVKASFQKVAAQADQDPKPGSVEAVGPAVNPTDGNPLITLGWTPEFIGQMWALIDKMTRRTASEAEAWRILLDEYKPIVKKGGDHEAVKTNTHFRNTQTKIAQLILRSPDVVIDEQPIGLLNTTKTDPITGAIVVMSDVLAVKSTLLNKTLRNVVKAGKLLDQIMFDIVGWAGISVVKVGYTATIRKVQKPIMGPDPNFQPPAPVLGSVLGLAPQGQPPQVPMMGPDGVTPQTQEVPVPIHSAVYMRRVSPLRVLIDPLCQTCDYDGDAGVLGYWFSLLPHGVKTLFGKSVEDFGANGGTGDAALKIQNKSDEGIDNPVIKGVELFIKTGYIDCAITHPNEPDYVPHPQQLYQLVLLEGVRDQPVVWRECIDQSFDENGALTEDSIDTFPIRVITIRDLAESAFPPSDAAFSNPIVKARNTGRRQQLAIREASIQKLLVDGGSLEDEDTQKIKNGQVPDIIVVKDGELKEKGVAGIIAGTPVPKVSADLYRLDADLKQDNDEAMGLNSNSVGATNDTVRAATEIATVQQAVAGRVQKEQTRFLWEYLEMVKILDTYLARYTTMAQYARIVGMDGVQRMQAWNGQMVAGKWMYDISPDTQMTVDTPQSLQHDLNTYNLLAKDPLVDRRPVLRKIFRKNGYDPVQCIMDPSRMGQQPPHGGPVSKEAGQDSGANSGGPQQGDHRENQQAGAGPEEQSQ